MQPVPHLITRPVRILLIDNQVVVRSGLRMLIESQSGLKVIGEAGTCTEALTIAAREQPDIILLDMDSDGGLDLLPKLLTAAKEARVLMLASGRDLEAYQHAVRLGAMGLVLKDIAAEDFIKAIKKIHAGEVWLDRLMTANVLAKMARGGEQTNPEMAKNATLTEREREVISVIGEGLKNKQIASRLFISETTVRHHLTSIFAKVGVSDRLELIIYAFRHGLAKLSR